jgi:hypothetical protein
VLGGGGGGSWPAFACYRVLSLLEVFWGVAGSWELSLLITFWYPRPAAGECVLWWAASLPHTYLDKKTPAVHQRSAPACVSTEHSKSTCTLN